MKLKIRGRKWKARRRPLKHYGECNYRARRIIVRAGLDPINDLAVLCHELLHAALPRLSERRVRRATRVLALALWRDHWRKLQKSS